MFKSGRSVCPVDLRSGRSGSQRHPARRLGHLLAPRWGAQPGKASWRTAWTRLVADRRCGRSREESAPAPSTRAAHAEFLLPQASTWLCCWSSRCSETLGGCSWLQWCPLPRRCACVGYLTSALRVAHLAHAITVGDLTQRVLAATFTNVPCGRRGPDAWLRGCSSRSGGAPVRWRRGASGGDVRGAAHGNALGRQASLGF
mmetsp:Transcript_108437/g.203533  ORF Transcript_108437/g.203533 Transcript_108437/m.203533 type:complete len:201 (+) Transcript_108437:316-918(+)